MTVCAGVLYAQDAQQVSSPPVITLEVGTESYSGILGDYCWMVAPGDVNCSYPARQPINSSILVSADQPVNVRLLTDAGDPQRISAAFLDSLGPDGDVRVVDLAPGAAAQLSLEGAAGLQRVDITAQYPSTGGDEQFVTYSFLFDVSQLPLGEAQGAVEPTAPQETLPTEAPVIVPTPAPTDVSAASPTEPPVAAPTQVPVQQPDASAGPVGDTVVFTVARPPALILRGSSENYEPIAQTYSARDARGATLRIDEPVAPAGRRLTVPSGGFFVISSPIQADIFRVTVFSESQQVITQGVVPGDRLGRFALNIPVGNYLIAVEAGYPSGNVVYTFRVAVV